MFCRLRSLSKTCWLDTQSSPPVGFIQIISNPTLKHTKAQTPQFEASCFGCTSALVVTYAKTVSWETYVEMPKTLHTANTLPWHVQSIPMKHFFLLSQCITLRFTSPPLLVQLRNAISPIKMRTPILCTCHAHARSPLATVAPPKCPETDDLRASSPPNAADECIPQTSPWNNTKVLEPVSSLNEKWFMWLTPLQMRRSESLGPHTLKVRSGTLALRARGKEPRSFPKLNLPQFFFMYFHFSW